MNLSGRLHDLLLWASGANGYKLLLLCTMWKEDFIQTGEARFKCFPESMNQQSETSLCLSQGVKLLSLPPIVCVHLKRFRNCRGNTRKLDCRVTFPETFDFSETLREAFSSDFAQVLKEYNHELSDCCIFCHPQVYFFFQNDCKYTLHAVVVHSGYAMCGHYTAYVRHRRNQSWYYADDSHTRQVHPIW